MNRKLLFIALLAGLVSSSLSAEKDSLPALKDGQSPQTIPEVWAGFDPRVEPVDTEVIKEWEEEGVVIRAVRYRIGIFKGEKAWMAALYAFPKGAKNLPAIVQIHGGGGMASKEKCMDNAKRGYATISLSWRGDPRYLKEFDLLESAQTDWGAVEGRQVNGTRDIKSESDLHYDPVDSARNHGYFLRTLAARRALTFLEQQPEVDGDRLGVDGFSMGGVITFMTAATDRRVKAASPWWAPPIILDDSLKSRTANTRAYAEHIHCPLMIMSPSNDFHGMVEHVAWMVDHIPSDEVRIARAVHLNHKNDAQTMAARELWFDSKLKDGYSFPEQPEFTVKLDATDGRPKAYVRPDDSMPISHVDIFYTRDAKESDNATNRTRYWQYAKPVLEGGLYSASVDLFDIEEPLWVFANVYYQVKQPAGDSPLTDPADVFTVTTRLKMFSAEELAQSRVKKDRKTTSVIESFGPDWEKEWIYSRNQWNSWKLNTPRIPVPEYGKLVLDVHSDVTNHITVEAGGYRGIFIVKGGPDAQRIEIYPFDLAEKKTKAKLLNWSALKRPMLTLAGSRSKPAPTFKLLAWEPITKADFMAKRPFQLGDAAKTDGKVMLTFTMADHVDGRYDAEFKSVKVDESNAGVDLNNGLQVHSQDVSEVTFFLNGAFSKFSATLIPCYQASAVFEVHADGKKLFESDIFRGKTPPKDIEVDLSGAQMLKLVITEGGNGWGGDWVMWGQAAVQ